MALIIYDRARPPEAPPSDVQSPEDAPVHLSRWQVRRRICAGLETMEVEDERLDAIADEILRRLETEHG